MLNEAANLLNSSFQKIGTVVVGIIVVFEAKNTGRNSGGGCRPTKAYRILHEYVLSTPKPMKVV